MTAYIDSSDVRNQVKKRSDKDDTAIEFLINVASEWVDRATGRPPGGFVASSTATPYIFPGAGGVVQWIPDCTQVTLVEVKNSVTDTTYITWASTDWLAASGEPKTPNYNRLPYKFLLIDPTGILTHFTSGKFASLRGFPPDPDANERGLGAPTVRVTAKWGYQATCPAPIKQIVLIQTVRWLKRAEGVWADAVASNNFEMMLFQKDLDPDVTALLIRGRWVTPSIGGREL